MRKSMTRKLTVFFLFLTVTYDFIYMALDRGILANELFKRYEYLCSAPIVLLLLPAWFKAETKPLRLKFEYIGILSVLPWVVSIAYTVFLVLWVPHAWFGIPSAVQWGTFTAYRAVLAALLVLKFRDKALDLVTEAVILSYSLTVVYAVAHIGLPGLVQYVSTMNVLVATGYNNYFEMHQIGETVGLLILWHVFLRKRTNWLTVCALTLIMVLCWKRIGIFAFLIMMGFYAFLHRRSVSRIYVSLCAVLAGVFTYIALIAGGLLYDLAAVFGFDFSNRTGIFSFAKQFYEWSVFFPGNGMRYINRFLYAGWLDRSRSIGQPLGVMHNDILALYIDLGFIGSVIWFSYHLWLLPRALQRHYGREVILIYAVVMVYYYILCLTDNALIFFQVQTVIMLLIYEVVRRVYDGGCGELSRGTGRAA